MKAHWSLSLLLLLLACGGCNQQSASPPPASQTPTNHSNIAPTNSLDVIRAKAGKGDAEAQYKLAETYIDAARTPENDAEAVKWLRKAADSGFAEAQARLGMAYERGVEPHLHQDLQEAMRWYRKASDQGNPRAQKEIGDLHRWGKGVETNATEAIRWYRMAAEQGWEDAQIMLGQIYSEGEGVPKDGTEAVKWYRKAAELGDSIAIRWLVDVFERGDGVPIGLAEAEKWRAALVKSYEIEVEAGNAPDYRYIELARICSGSESVKWLRKAAERGGATSQATLGLWYAKGNGVPQDYVEAHKWLNLAIAQNHYVSFYKFETNKRSADLSFAIEEFKELERLMTLEQIAEAQRLAREFKPRKSSTPSQEENAIPDSNPSASGSGFVITADGYLISNEHVVKNATQVRLVTSAGLISAKVVKVDAANDLALLKAEGKFSPLPVASSRSVKLGATVATVGFPNIGLQGFAPKLAKGEIASLSGAGDDARYFQISVPVQPGNSGGALVDERGNVVGVVAAKLSARAALASSGALPENVNYAVKSSFLLGFLESVPEVSAKLKEPETKAQKFEDVVKAAEQAAVLVLVY